MKNITSHLAAKFPILKELKPLRLEFNPLGPEELVWIEQQLGTPIPDVYRALLLEIGGSGFRAAALFPPIEEAFGGENEGIDFFFGAKCEGDYWIWTNISRYKDDLPTTMIPIGGNFLGHLICIGIAGPERGKVYFYDRDIGKACLAAESFEDFLNKLEIEED